jgi:Leucine-rich repeat (LRR) protein
VLTEGPTEPDLTTELSFAWSKITALPGWLCSLDKLTTLNLRECKRLAVLPEAIGELRSLVTLHLSRCGRLKLLPPSMSRLKQLRLLNLFQCGSLEEPLPELSKVLQLVAEGDGAVNLVWHVGASDATKAWVQRGLTSARADAPREG